MVASPPSVEAVAAFIENIHIFHGVTEDDLFAIAERLEDKVCAPGEVILESDQPAPSFYIIYAGRVDVTRENGGQKNSRFSPGDYFGADIFFSGQKRNTKIIAKTEVLLLELPGSLFPEIPDAVDFLRGQLEAFLIRRELLEKVNFDWIEENEAIYFVANKHPILFWQRAFIPLLLFFGAPFAIFFGMWYGALIPLIASGVGFVVAILWLIWNYLDYGNDYYIVTNERVVWIEKIIGVFDSRQEAHLGEVKSVNVNTDVLVQSAFDYGHVNVNTIFGGVELRFIPSPRQAHILIEELWQRSKIANEKRAKDRLHQAIRDQIKDAHSTAEKKRSGLPKPKKEAVKLSFWQKLFKREKKKKKKNPFSLRYEQGKEIVYRKHFMVLLTKVGFVAFLTLIATIYVLVQISLLIVGGNTLALSYIMLLVAAIIVAYGWIIYQYIDWRNDIFKVSQDKIFDIDRKPFGDVQSRSSELKNIESIEYRREGLMSIFFNYGTVYIHIGSEEFEFEDVLDPAGVQQDINHRYKAIQEQARLAEEKKERGDMIKWLVAYHESTEDIDDMLAEIRRIKRQQSANYVAEEGEEDEEEAEG